MPCTETVQGIFLYRSCFLFRDIDIHTIDFHILIGTDEDIFHTADDSCLNEVTAGGITLDDHIRCLNLKMLVINDILRMQVGFKTKNFIIVHTELGHMFF